MDIDQATATINKARTKDESVLVTAGVDNEPNLELSNMVITKEFVNWNLARAEKDKPKEDMFKSVAGMEVAAAIRFHASIAHLKRRLGSYFATLLSNQEQAVIAGSEVWHDLYKQMQELTSFVETEKNLLEPLTRHSLFNGGGAHPLVQKLWQSYAQLLYLQVEADCRPENPYIHDMVDMYNKFIQSCLARTHVSAVDESEYDNNDPTMGIVRLNQVLAIQGKFDEYVPNTKMLIDFSLNKSGPNLLASTQCILLAITVRAMLLSLLPQLSVPISIAATLLTWSSSPFPHAAARRDGGGQAGQAVGGEGAGDLRVLRQQGPPPVGLPGHRGGAEGQPQGGAGHLQVGVGVQDRRMRK